ncbi:hypothetical protein RRG08_007519, partial [Elysia crispata]
FDPSEENLLERFPDLYDTPELRAQSVLQQETL